MDRSGGDRKGRTGDRWPYQGLSRRGMLRLAAALVTTGGWEGRAEQGWGAFERLHLPTLRMPSFTHNGAHVPLVIEMEHPMEPEHYIKNLQVLNASDPIPSKGVFHLTPSNGQAYLAVQARMHSGTSTVQVIAECNRHGCWVESQPITIPEGTGGCATITAGQEYPPAAAEIRPPVIRIPELVQRGSIRQGDIIQVQVKCKHPNRTGLAVRAGQFVQETEPFYLKAMEVFYGEHLVSRYEMTPALSDNPFMTFKLRMTDAWPIRIVLTNSRGQCLEATEAIRLS